MQMISELSRAVYFDSAQSFAMIRGEPFTLVELGPGVAATDVARHTTAAYIHALG